MSTRADAVAQTRVRIVDAAKAVHAERGVLASNWEDIAERAGMSTATVYRHFPSLAELIPACARSVFDLIQPPTLAEAGVQFAALPQAGDRFDRLVRESCHCYQPGADWLHAAHRERDFVPELGAALEVIQGTLRVLVTAAAGRELEPADHGELFVLCDFPLWKSLLDAGLPGPTVEDTLVQLVRAEAARIGLH